MPRPTNDRIEGARRSGATHIVVCCDTFDYEDYCIEVYPGDSLEQIKAEHNGKNMQKVMEVIEVQPVIEARLARLTHEMNQLQADAKRKLVYSLDEKGRHQVTLAPKATNAAEASAIRRAKLRRVK